MKDAQKKAEEIRRSLVSPGDEEVSIQYVDYMKSSLGSYLEYLAGEIKGVEMKLAAFQAAHDSYLKQEHSSVQSIKRV